MMSPTPAPSQMSLKKKYIDVFLMVLALFSFNFWGQRTGSMDGSSDAMGTFMMFVLAVLFYMFYKISTHKGFLALAIILFVGGLIAYQFISQF